VKTSSSSYAGAARVYTLVLIAHQCKHDDDLRKDARVMEFNALINRLLKQVRALLVAMCDVCAECRGATARALRAHVQRRAAQRDDGRARGELCCDVM
jgi:hypothetical protein